MKFKNPSGKKNLLESDIFTFRRNITQKEVLSDNMYQKNKWMGLSQLIVYEQRNERDLALADNKILLQYQINMVLALE